MTFTLCAVPAGADRVFLLGEREHFLLRGKLYAAMAPLLDGRRTVDEVIAALEGQASAAEVHYALMRLDERGYLDRDDEARAPGAACAVEAMGGEDAAMVVSLQTSRDGYPGSEMGAVALLRQ